MPPDLAVHLWRSGYHALAEERARASVEPDSHAFESRLMGHRAVVVSGREGARLFYDTSVVQRSGAMPPPLAALLFGNGAVHGLDDEAHAARKAIHLEVLTEDHIRPLAEAIGRDLERRTRGWAGREVVVFDELVQVYGPAVLAWAGLAVSPRQTPRISRRLAAIVDGFGAQDLAYPKAWAARLWANRWARRAVERVRSGAASAPNDTALQILATGSGRDLDPKVAAVELLNLLRPTVAVAWPATFAALALVEHPQWRPLLTPDRHDEHCDDRLRAFGHEVRRTCPFVPALAGRARRSAEIAGVRIEPGDLIVLDVPGTNHHPEAWQEPHEFLPERFAEREPDPFEYVPQGGGDPTTGHRCPGEPLAVRMLSQTVRVLAGVDYRVAGPASYDPTRMPALPGRGLVVRVP